MALGALRLSIGAVALLAALPLVGGSMRGALALWRRVTVWVMAVCTAIFQPLFFAAIERAGVAMSALLAIGAVPVFAGFVSWLVLRRRPSLSWAGATAVAVVGLAMRSSSELRSGDALGATMALVAAFAVSCYVVAAKIELGRGTHAVEMPAAVYALASLLLLPAAATQPLGWVVSLRGSAVVLYLGVVTMGLGNALAIRGMRGLAPPVAATLLLSEPVMATLLGVVALGEPLSFVEGVGVVLVLIGLVWQARAAVDAESS